MFCGRYHCQLRPSTEQSRLAISRFLIGIYLHLLALTIEIFFGEVHCGYFGANEHRSGVSTLCSAPLRGNLRCGRSAHLLGLPLATRRRMGGATARGTWRYLTVGNRTDSASRTLQPSIRLCAPGIASGGATQADEISGGNRDGETSGSLRRTGCEESHRNQCPRTARRPGSLVAAADPSIRREFTGPHSRTRICSGGQARRARG